MTRRHKPTPGEIVMSQAWLAGIHGIPELAKRTGIPRATMYQRIAEGGWSLEELKAVDRAIRLDDEAKVRIFGGEQ